MRDKYIYINTAGFKNGLFVTLSQVYGDGGISYEAIVYGRTQRGVLSKLSSFRNKNRSLVCAWRETRRADAR